MARGAWGLVCACVCVCAAAACVGGAGADQDYLVLHVTDVHGWIDAHPHNATLNADFGDFASLLEHLTRRCAQDGKELLLFDSGDIVEGTGISDATDVHGEYVFPIIEQIANYTALTMGNHDIGHSSTVALMRRTFIPHFNAEVGEPRYLTSNSFAKVTPPGVPSQGTGKAVSGAAPEEMGMSPLGQQYTLRTGATGQRMLILGFMFNFTWEASITSVDPVSESLEQKWFFEAMMAGYDADVIFVPMHIDPQSAPEMQEVFAAIRRFHPSKPVGFFAGHRHRMFWDVLDDNAFVIESGKYFEELGVIEFTITDDGLMQNVRYEWLPTTVDNFVAFAGVASSNFLTPLGHMIKGEITEYSNRLHLKQKLGCSPQFYSPDAHYYAHDSLYHLYIDSIVPAVVFNASLPNTQFFISNTAALRYPLFPGVVTVNDIWTIAPFKDVYEYYTDVPGSMLKQFLHIINTMPSAKIGRAPYERHTKVIRNPGTGFALSDEDDDDKLPNYYWSDVTVDAAGTYDLVMPQYDADQLQPVLRENFPSYDATFSRYPTDLSSTSSLAQYVVANMRCSSACPC